MATEETFEPDWASPPGDNLADLLEERPMTQAELAERLGVSAKHVNRVIKGAAPVSAELALGLEKVLGVSADFWLALEAQYRADLARISEHSALAGWVDWALTFPVADLRKRGLLPADAEGVALVEGLLRFLGVAHPDQWSAPAVAYRKSKVFQSDSRALSVWLREGENEAASVACAPYSAEAFKEALVDVRAMTAASPDAWWPALQLRCAQAGVAVVVVDEYKGAKANGATRWLSPEKALIQLSLRHRWEDIFWFSFFHEAGHVLLHRKKDCFVETSRADRSVDPELMKLESEADKFAAEMLIPREYDAELTGLRLPEVTAFAEKVGVGPAIVVGRLHHEGLPYSQGNWLRRTLKFER